MNTTRTILAIGLIMSILVSPVVRGGVEIEVTETEADSVGIGSWVISPYVDVNFTDDSNVYKQPTNEIADTFFEPELGVRFSSSSETNCISAIGNLFYSQREYTSERNMNFKTYGDNLTLRYGNGLRSLIELIQSYRSISDNDRHASDIESSGLSAEMIEDSNTLDDRREVNQLGASISRRMTDKLDLGLSYRYSGVSYDNEDRGLDLDGHIVQFDGDLGLTEKTDAFLTLRQGLQVQEGTDGSSDLTTARLGLRRLGSDKLVYNVGAGLERYARPPQFDETPKVLFSFNASADWFVTEKITFRCGGYNGTQFSSFYEGNSLEYISGWGGLGYRWKPSTIFSVRGIYRKDDYLDQVMDEGQSVDRMDKRVEGHARVDYIAPCGFLRLYLEATYDEVDSNIDTVDYVDRRFILGVNVRY